ncbi:hypothetical protein GTW93_18135, partial [Streptomyces sp. SID5789]|nr:hypothetical protein [Streptomyces sp. SID5789]
MSSHGNDNEPRSEPPGPAATTPRPPDADPAPGLGDVPPGAGGDAARIVAVRRFAAAARRWRGLQVTGCAVLLAVALSAGAVAVGGARE